MTAPSTDTTNPGATDATPTTGGSQPYAASGAAGADAIEAPDAVYGSVHRPGYAPGVDINEGPALMRVGASGKSRKKKK